MKKQIIFLILILNSIILNAQSQVGQDINGVENGHQIGASVALSLNGQIMAIGSGLDGNNGSVSIYQYNISNTSWEQLGNTIIINDYHSGAAFFGTNGNVSLSSDGTRLAVGAPDTTLPYPYSGQNDGLVNNGSTYVYDYNGTDWIQFGSTIEGSNTGDYSGASVSLSASGNRLAISGSKKSKIYESNGTDWDLIATFNENQFSLISLSSDGNKAVIINPIDNSRTGKVRFLTQSGSNWIQYGQTLYGESTEDRFGSSHSLSEDGNLIAIGAYNDDNNGDNSGSVKTYLFNGTAWEQMGQELNGMNNEDHFGASVSLTTTGMNRLVIGIPLKDDAGNDSGQVQIFDYDGVNWIQKGNNINGVSVDDEFGGNVYLLKNGLFLATGTRKNNNWFGKARVYDLSNESLTVENITLSKKSNLYPNPTKSSLTLLDSEIKVNYVIILDNIGQFVKKTFLINNKIDLSNLANGVYYLKIHTDNNIITKKALKK